MPGLDPYFDRTEGMITRAQAGLLYELAKQVPGDRCIVEVGSYRGRSTVALARGSLDGSRAPVFAVDPHEEFRGIFGGEFGPSDRGAFFQAMLSTSSYHIVHLINLSSEIVTPGWNRIVGFLWIDGDHREGAVRRDWNCWRSHLAPDAVVAFDDSVRADIGPQRLVAELLASKDYDFVDRVEKVTVIRRVSNVVNDKKP